MRKFAATLAAVALLVVGAPLTASAGGEDLANGVNGIVTSPMDVVHGFVEPERLVDLGPVNVVSDRVTGVGVGLFTAVKRVVTGAVDVLTFPVTDKVKGPHSPDARYRVLGAEAAAE